MPSKIQFVPDNSDSKTNWMTVVTGENGTRKSLLLRLLAGAVWWSSFFGHINRLLSCRFLLESIG